jgi:hypothetical protein
MFLYFVVKDGLCKNRFAISVIADFLSCKSSFFWKISGRIIKCEWFLISCARSHSCARQTFLSPPLQVGKEKFEQKKKPSAIFLYAIAFINMSFFIMPGLVSHLHETMIARRFNQAFRPAARRVILP